MRNYHIRYPEDMEEGEEPEDKGGDVHGMGQDSITIKPYGLGGPDLNLGISNKSRR